jgi:hypothetical protein
MFHQAGGAHCDDNSHDRRAYSRDLPGEGGPRGLIAISIEPMFESWSETPKPSAAQLTALRHLQSDLSPVLACIDGVADQTNDPALIQAAERVHDALRGLLGEMAVVIHRARRRSGG